MEHFVIIVNYRWKPLTIITKRSILDVAAVPDTPLFINFKLITNLYFKWIQLVHAIPYYRKKTLWQTPSKTFCWKSNRERALFDITSTWNSHSNLTKVSWEDVLRFDFAVEAYFTYYHTKAVVWRCSASPATLLKKRLWHRCFPLNFAKFLRTPFLQDTSGRLLLDLY